MDNISYINDILYIVSSLTQKTLTNNDATDKHGAGCQKELFFLPAWVWQKVTHFQVFICKADTHKYLKSH